MLLQLLACLIGMCIMQNSKNNYFVPNYYLNFIILMCYLANFHFQAITYYKPTISIFLNC